MISDTETMLLIASCVNCGAGVAACPECVVTMWIDPETGLPPDVKIVDGRAVSQPIDPAAQERSYKAILCDTCVELRNARSDTPIETSTARHSRTHAVT